MPFDGVLTKCVTAELSDKIVNGRIEKITQPEFDEINLFIRANGENHRLVLSCDSNYPRIHITKAVKDNPPRPPLFCMILRKHISGGKILAVESPDYERVLKIKIESSTELGDLTVKTLIIEIMGRYSNVILVNGNNVVLDAIRHIDIDQSSVRQIMPARIYIAPPPQEKSTPDEIDARNFFTVSELAIEKFMLEKIKGFSPLLCREICRQANVEPKKQLSDITAEELKRLVFSLENTIERLIRRNFSPCLIYKEEDAERPADFYCLPVSAGHIVVHDSINEVLDIFFSAKDKANRQVQKKSELNKILNTSIERCNRKLAIQQETLREVSDRDKLRLYGELILANLHTIQPDSEAAEVVDYYSDNLKKLIIPLDKNKSPQDNAQRYFKKYTKAKSTYSFTGEQIKKTIAEIDYLESVRQMLENSSSVDEIDEIRDELREEGYIRSGKTSRKKKAAASKPMHFISSDGFDIFAGKNNRQNDTLTLKTASNRDLWLHVRQIPGSHVIIRSDGKEIPDTTLLQAAKLAAYYSKARASLTADVDYTSVKNVKKPAGAKPGMVIYNDFKTIRVQNYKKTPDLQQPT